jgi:asparagine synthase (glutamine-hydrolysing)
MDPSGGDQPLYNEARSLTIVANGEVYNFPRLRAELAHRHRFATTSDTEAILHLYEECGSDVAQALDGMYAFVIADGAQLFAARDPIGIKPLYYGERAGALLFASELKAFPAGCRSIREFPAGAFLNRTGEFSSFYDLPPPRAENVPLEEHMRQLRTGLAQAVGKRLMSDVPLGAFLSGGLDSSIIAALARPHLDEFHTFSVGMEGSPDILAARRVARHLDTTHHEYLFTEGEVQDRLPEIVYYLESFDQDLVRSAVPCYFTSRLAADHVKVILTGEGADELFGGYRYYQEIGEGEDLAGELRRSVLSLHNINLQRVDRMTMCHSIEGRVPFLDLAMIDLGQRVPPEAKIAGTPPVEKWILRKTFEDLLPPEIVWRKKEQFDEGSGTADLLSRIMPVALGPAEAAGLQARYPDVMLRSSEECAYFRLFLDVYEEPDRLITNVARWAEPRWS